MCLVKNALFVIIFVQFVVFCGWGTQSFKCTDVRICRFKHIQNTPYEARGGSLHQ